MDGAQKPWCVLYLKYCIIYISNLQVMSLVPEGGDGCPTPNSTEKYWSWRVSGHKILVTCPDSTSGCHVSREKGSTSAFNLFNRNRSCGLCSETLNIITRWHYLFSNELSSLFTEWSWLLVLKASACKKVWNEAENDAMLLFKYYDIIEDNKLHSIQQVQRVKHRPYANNKTCQCKYFVKILGQMPCKFKIGYFCNFALYNL